VVEPTFRLEDLQAEARMRNPALIAERASERAADMEHTNTQRSFMLPRLSISTSLSGATNMLSNATGDERTWPFGFERSPYNFRVGLSYEIWNRYGRESAIQQRSIAESNARNALRQRELQVQSDVATALLDLQVAWQTIALQNQAVDNARQAMLLARERYSVGSANFIEVTTASDNYQTAENQRLGAIYNYHRAFAALEAAVGRPLR
jgi:outer membrane protein TolC